MLRIPVVAVALAVCLSAIGYFEVARHQSATVRLPDRKPSNARWVWPDGVPGWVPGETIRGYPVSGLQPIEVQAAALAAAHRVLDASAVRVIGSTRPGYGGPFAVLATKTLDTAPALTCLAALLPSEPVHWMCPAKHTLSHKHVFAAAGRLRWAGGKNPIFLTGVARGDVTRIVLVGGVVPREEIYVRAKTWGEFDLAEAVRPGGHLLVYVGRRLVETVPLDLGVGQRRVLT
jgi:hypothetical protein